ncbi:MAG: hypothetical protein IJV65_02850 [Kiritimatiellae bacterium]|nr:hypothetical protein [Kiritimatiellia bacterium]
MKERYSKGVQERKQEALVDRKLREAIERGEQRREKYGDNWQSVDLTEFAAKFAPGAEPEYHDGKIYFQSPGSDLRIVADVGGGYCRLEDTSLKGKNRYLGIDGTPLPHNIVGPNGKQRGMPPEMRKALTHFTIRKGN